MSETTTQNGTPAGTDVNTDVSQLDPELVKQLLALKAKDDERKEKLAKAAAERKRTNARGTLPDGTTERNPVQAYLSALGALLSNWTEMYQDAPAEMIRRMNEAAHPEHRGHVQHAERPDGGGRGHPQARLHVVARAAPGQAPGDAPGEQHQVVARQAPCLHHAATPPPVRGGGGRFGVCM